MELSVRWLFLWLPVASELRCYRISYIASLNLFWRVSLRV